MNQRKLEVIKQEMARVNIDILRISKLKWTGMGEFNSDEHCIYLTIYSLDELPRSVGAQYVTGDQWRKNSRKNEDMEPKQKQQPAVDVTGDGSKVRCCKE